jgi:hypothetical protein
MTETELPLSNGMGQFNASDGVRRSSKGLEAGHGSNSSLDGPVISLDHVVEVLVASDEHVAPAGVLPVEADSTSRLY